MIHITNSKTKVVVSQKVIFLQKFRCQILMILFYNALSCVLVFIQLLFHWWIPSSGHLMNVIYQYLTSTDQSTCEKRRWMILPGEMQSPIYWSVIRRLRPSHLAYSSREFDNEISLVSETYKKKCNAARTTLTVGSTHYSHETRKCGYASYRSPPTILFCLFCGAEHHLKLN